MELLLKKTLLKKLVKARRCRQCATGRRRDQVDGALDASLERLGVDAVDLLWAHVEDRTTPLEETAGALRAEWEAGRTGAIGVSNHATWRLERLRAALESGGGPALKAGGGPALKAGGGPALAALQYRYSYLQPRPGIQAEGQANRMGYLSADVRDFAAETGAEVWAYTSLLQGSYDRHDRPFPPSYHHEGNEARLAVLAEVAQEVGHTRRGGARVADRARDSADPGGLHDSAVGIGAARCGARVGAGAGGTPGRGGVSLRRRFFHPFTAPGRSRAVRSRALRSRALPLPPHGGIAT